jgi:hypothetical protein
LPTKSPRTRRRRSPCPTPVHSGGGGGHDERRRLPRSLGPTRAETGWSGMRSQ